MCIIPRRRLRACAYDVCVCVRVCVRSSGSFSNSLESRRRASKRVYAGETKRFLLHFATRYIAAGNCAQTFCFTAFSSSLFHYSFLSSLSLYLCHEGNRRLNVSTFPGATSTNAFTIRAPTNNFLLFPYLHSNPRYRSSRHCGHL